MSFRARRKYLALVTAAGVASGVVLASAATASGGRRRAHRAQGAVPTTYGVDIQAVYDAHGNPSLVANFSPDGSLAKPRWAVCPPPDTSVCTAVNSASQFLQPGATSAGTVFQASASYQGRTYTARTATWTGTVHAIRAPRLDGHARVGARARPLRARWVGGWQRDPAYRSSLGADSAGRAPAFDLLSVEACRTRSGRHCVTLTPQRRPASFARRPLVVRRRLVGWYLFAFDERFAADTAFATPAYPNPANIPPLKVGPTVARSAPLGPVGA